MQDFNKRGFIPLLFFDFFQNLCYNKRKGDVIMNNPCEKCFLSEKEQFTCNGCPQRDLYLKQKNPKGCQFYNTCDSHTTTCKAFPPEYGCILYKILKPN